MLQYVGKDGEWCASREVSIDFTTSKGKNYRIHGQVLTPGQYPRIIEFGLENGCTLLHITYAPTFGDGVVLRDEMLIYSGFQALKSAAETVELGSVGFFDIYATQRDIPLRAVLNGQIPNLIADGQRVRVIVDNGTYYEGCIVSREDDRIRFRSDKGDVLSIDLDNVKEVQLI